jgi:hypothetical protein
VFVFDRILRLLAWRKQVHPAGGDHVVGPCCHLAGIDTDHQVQMIAHHSIGVDGHCKAFGDLSNPRFYPLLAMLEGAAGMAIDSAQKSPTHAPLDAMVGAGGV